MTSLLDTARHCRELMRCAQNSAVLEQLRVWMEELEQHAQTLAQKPEELRGRVSIPPPAK
jgi:hypothetical protein